MGTKYTSQSISGYNTTPPADDGTATEANRITWAKIKTKITDPIKTLVEAINTALATHFDESVVNKSANFTTTAAEHKRVINVTASATITLGDATTMATSYMVWVKNNHTAAITVDLDTGTDTLDGTVDGSRAIPPGQAVLFSTNAAADGYESLSQLDGATLVLKEGSDHAPTVEAGYGFVWTKDDAPNVLMYTDDAGNDFQVSHSPEVATHTRAGNMQIVNGDLAITTFVASTELTEDTWESVGPTGSGADNIWADMDNIPANATILIVDVELYVDPTGTSFSGVLLYAARGDVASPTKAIEENGIAHLSVDPDADRGEYVNTARAHIPLESTNQTFKLLWDEFNSEAGTPVRMYYRGFMTD